MRSQKRTGLVVVLGLATFICAFHTTTAIDIPLEGECCLVILDMSNEYIFTNECNGQRCGSLK